MACLYNSCWGVCSFVWNDESERIAGTLSDVAVEDVAEGFAVLRFSAWDIAVTLCGSTDVGDDFGRAFLAVPNNDRKLSLKKYAFVSGLEG